MKGSLEYFVHQYQRVSTRGIAVQEYSSDPTRFDSMANNSCNIDAPPLLSTLLLLSCLRLTVRCYTTVRLYATITFYGKLCYASITVFVRSMLMIEALCLTLQRLVVQPEPSVPPPFIDYFKIVNGC